LCVCYSTVCLSMLFVFSNDLSDAKVASYPETEAADDRSWAEIGKLVCVVTYILLGAFIAVHKGSVGFPRMRGLVLELLAIRIKVMNPSLDLTIHDFFNFGTSLEHLGRALSDILSESVGRS